MVNYDLTDEQKAQINSTITQMVADGASEEDILAYKEQALSEVKPVPVEDQTDAPVQETSTESVSEEPSSDFQLDDEQKETINANVMNLVANGAGEKQINEYKTRAIEEFKNPPTQQDIEMEAMAKREDHTNMLKDRKMTNTKNNKLDDLEQMLRGQRYDQANKKIKELNDIGYDLPEVSFDDPKKDIYGENFDKLREKPNAELKVDDVEIDQPTKENEAAVAILKNVWKNKWKLGSPTGYLSAITDPEIFSDKEQTADNDGLLNLSEYSNMSDEERAKWDKDFQEGKAKLTPWESSLRSLEQNVNRLATIDDRVLSAVGLVMSNSDSELLQDAGQAMISVGKEQQERADDISGSTIGFTDLPDREDKFTSSLAALFGAGLNVGTSVAEAAVPGLLAVDMVSQSIYDYNKAKADELGITMEELAETGGVETTSALMLGAAAFALERTGIKGIRNYINKMPMSAKQGLIDILSTGGKEGVTELLQYYTETFNTSTAKHRAQGLSQKDAFEKAAEEVGNNLTSKEAVESFIQGAFGGKIIAGGGRLARRGKPGIVDRSEDNLEQLDDATKQVRNLEDMKHQRKLTKEEKDQITAAQQIAEKDQQEKAEEPYLQLADVPKEDLQQVLSINNTVTELHSKAAAVEASDKYTPEEKATMVASYDKQIETLTAQAFEIVEKGRGKDKTQAPKEQSPVKTVMDKLALDEEQLVDEKKFVDTKNKALAAEVEEFSEPVNKLYEGALDKFGVEILPAQGTLRKGTENKLRPLTKDGEEFSKGDFVKTVDSTRPMDKEEAGRAKTYIDNQAKRAGIVSQVKVLKNDDGSYGIKGAIKSPKRGGNLDNIIKEEITPVEETAEVKETPKAEETTERQPADAALEYAQAETKDTGKAAYEGTPPTATIEGGVFYEGLSDTKEFKKAGVYSTLGKLKKAGYPDAKYELSDEGLTIIPGKLDESAKRGELSIAESEDFEQHNDLRSADGSRVKLNIGLENNPKDRAGVLEALSKDPRVTLGSSEQVTGEYEGNPERTVVVDAKFDGPRDQFNALVENLNKELTQEAIGTTFDGDGNLIYDPAFKGDRYTFDKEFFIEPTQTAQSPASVKGVTSRKREEIQAEEAPKGPSTSPEVIDRLIRIKPPTIPVEGAKSQPRDSKGKFIQSAERPLAEERTLEEIETQETRIHGRIADLDALIADAKENNETPSKKWLDTKTKLENKLKELNDEKRTPQKDLERQLRGTELNEEVVSNWIENPEANAKEAVRNSLKYAFAVARKAQRGEGFTLDPDLQQLASEVVSEAYNTGKVGGQEFNPTNLQEAKQKIGGLVKGAIRNYYVGEGATAGVSGRNAASNARLNKVRKATEYISKKYGQAPQGSVKVGKGKTSMRIDATDYGQVADILNEGFKVNGKLIQDETITPEKAMELIARETQVVDLASLDVDVDGDPISSFFTESLGYDKTSNTRASKGEAVRNALESVGRKKGNNIAKSLGIPQDHIDDLIRRIGAVASRPPLVLDPDVVGKLNTDQKRALQSKVNKAEDTRLQKISQMVTSEVEYKWLKENYVDVANAISENGDKLADFFKTEFIENQNNRAKPARDFRNFVSNFLAAELEGAAVRSPKIQRKMADNPLGELSINENHANFLDVVETKGDPTDNRPWNGERVSNEIVPDLIASISNNQGRFDGNNFVLINTGKSPNKKNEILKQTENFPEAFGVKVVPHPNNPGRLIIGNANGEFASTIDDLVETTGRGDKLIDVDFRDFKNINNGLKDFINQYKGLIKNDRYGVVRALKSPGQIKYTQQMLLSNGFYPKYPKKDARGNTYIEFTQFKKPGRTVSASVNEAFNPMKRADKAYTDAMIKRLKKAWPGMRISTDKADVARASRLLGAKPGQVVNGAWLENENLIVLNEGTMSYDTPIHEFAHVWARGVVRENTDLWKRGAELLTGAKFDENGRFVLGSINLDASEYARAVWKVPQYRRYLESGNVARFVEEVMANAIGKHGATLTNDKIQNSRWQNWLKDLSSWVKSKLKISSPKDFSELTMKDFLDIGVEGVVTGTAPTPAQNAKVQGSLIENSTEQANETVQRSIENDIAKRAPKKGKWFNRLGSAIAPPSSDDFRGLVYRANKKTNKFTNKLQDLMDSFVEQNNNYVDAASAARTGFSGMVDNLKKSLKKDGLGNLDKPSKTLTYGGQPISISQAIGVYMNIANAAPEGKLTKKELKAIKDKIEGNRALTDFVLNMRFSPTFRGMQWQIGMPVNAQIVNFIEKGLKKRELAGFIEKKKAFQKKDMNNVYEEMGQRYGDALDNALDRMSGNDGRGTDPLTGKWDKWATGAVGATMFLNAKSAALQLISASNYMLETNPLKFMGNVANLPQLKADMKMLWNDPFLKERRARAGYDVNLEELANSLNADDMGEGIRKLLNKGFVLTSSMDSAAITLGGAAYYRTLRQQGKSHEEAIKQWREKSEEAQQSSRADWVSQQQKSGASKYILAFANTPMQYFRLSQKAGRVLMDKNASGADKARAVSKIFYYMGVQNAIFSSAQALSNALLFGWDGDEEEKQEAIGIVNSMSNSILRGMGFYGAVVNALKEAAFRAHKQSKKPNPNYAMALLKGGLEISPPLGKKAKDLIAIGDAFKYDKDETGVKSPWATAAAKGTVTLTNLPTDWLQKKAIATKELLDDEYTNLQASLMMLGYGEWNFRDSKKKKEGEEFDYDNFDFDDFDFDSDDLDLD